MKIEIPSARSPEIYEIGGFILSIGVGVMGHSFGAFLVTFGICLMLLPAAAWVFNQARKDLEE